MQVASVKNGQAKLIFIALSVPIVIMSIQKPNNACAADWALTPAVSLNIINDDNLFLATQNKTSTWESVIDTSVGLSRNTENNNIMINERLAARHYDYMPALDRNDSYTSLLYGYDAERYTFRINGAYAQESTLTSELVDTGVVQVVRTVNQKTLSPQLNYQMSPRSTLKMSFDYLDKKYDAPITEFSPYTTHATTVNYAYALDETVNLQANVTRSNVDIPDGAYGYQGLSLLTKSNNYQLGFTYNYAENIDLSVLYGERSSEDEIKYLGYLLFPASHSKGSTYNVVLRKSLASGSVKFQLSRDYSPAGTGVVYETDNATLGMQFLIDERNSINLDITYLNQKPGSSSYSAVQRTYYSIQPGYSWQVAENWSLHAYYRYVHQKYDISADAAESNSVSLSMAYTWPYYHF